MDSVRYLKVQIADIQDDYVRCLGHDSEEPGHEGSTLEANPIKEDNRDVGQAEGEIHLELPANVDLLVEKAHFVYLF